MKHVDIEVRPLEASDAEPLVQAFAACGWSKPVELFERYLGEQQAGTRVCVVAASSGELAGYCTLLWRSEYAPFRESGTPEISDLNVLPHHRRRGAAGAMLDELEACAATSSDRVGLGVGLYADYGAAQRLYVQRGYVPDGAGVMYRSHPVRPGAEMTLDDDATLMLVRRLG